MASLSSLIPIFGWAARYDRRDLRPDLAAGLTVGAMLVPQAMAYALLAGLPPEVGLYASIVPVVLYAVFGGSRQLAVGPVAIVSLLTASALAPLAEQGSADYLAAAATLALLVGLVHLAIGASRLGFVVNFLSHAVLVGFTAGAALIIGFSQLKHLLGISVERKDYFTETVIEYARNLDQTHGTTLLVGLLAVAMLVGLKRWFRAVPAALVVVLVTIGISVLFDLEARGVSTVGEIPGQLPALALPELGGGLIGDLLPTAVVITLVGFMESIAIAKVYARRNRYQVEPNQELVALGAANVGGGVFGAYPVTGGFSRTAVNASAGARTPLASLITAGVVLVTVVALTPAFEPLPQATLGAIVVVAVTSLVDRHEIAHLAAVDRGDLLTALVAFLATLVVGIELGILVAAVFSVLVILARQARPHTAVLGRLPGTEVYRNVERFADAELVPGVLVLRIDSALNFMNATFLRPHVEHLLHRHAPVRSLVLDMAPVVQLDASAEQSLSELIDELDGRGVELHLAAPTGPVRDVLIRSGLWERLGPVTHASVAAAVDSVEGHPRELDARAAGIDERG